MRKLVLPCLVAMVFLLGACAEPNSDAPAGGIHALDGSFLDGSVHGPVAKQDLTFCQDCHGEAGGPGSNPAFNVGIDSQGGNGCESCHGVNIAHPQDWAGASSTFHYSAGNIQQACTLCHGAGLDGGGGAVGPSCLQCHDSPTALTLDCTACHNYPPDGTIHFGTINGVDHSDVPLVPHSECTICHGMSESMTGGSFDPETNYNLFDKATDTLGDHWDGNIQMNSDVSYSDTNFGCDNASCHGNDVDHRLTDSGLPVVLEGYGSVAAPHALDSSYLAGNLHGPEAKQDLTVCQACHGEAGGPGSNPAFNVGIFSAGGDGCQSSGCHDAANLAHPQDWAGANSTFHYSAGSIQEACTLCHGASLDGAGGVGPSCLQCHDSAVAFTLDCTACHNYPPDGTLHAGTISGVNHSEITVGFHAADCYHCHGVTETAAGGGFEPSPNYDLFEIATDTVGDHFNGNINMNNTPGYNDSNYGCDTAGCHLNDPGHQFPNDSGLPVLLENYGL